MIRIFLNGCNGKMGHEISSIVTTVADMEIVAGADLNTEPLFGYPVHAQPDDCQEDFDVLIDFSNPAALPGLQKLIERKKKPSIICTTGLSDEQKQTLQTLSQTAPIFFSANMSLGINVLANLARQAARLLFPEFDIEIIEAHHNQKVDAPSGTALLLADQVKEILNQPIDYVYDRTPTREKRKLDQIGIHAIRGGNIVGDHTVLFAGPEETIELKHRAQSRAVFARGALSAARFMAGKEPGFYSMEELVAQFSIRKDDD